MSPTRRVHCLSRKPINLVIRTEILLGLLEQLLEQAHTIRVQSRTEMMAI